MMITVMKAILKSLLLALVAATFSSCAFDGSYSSSYGGGVRQVGYTPSYSSPHDTYIVEDTSHVTAYGHGSNRVYTPPTRPKMINPLLIEESFSEKVYDSYGFLHRGVYYQTQPKQGISVYQRELARAQWPD